METQPTRRMGRRALFAAGLGGAALAAAQALGAPARTLAANGASMLIGRMNTGSHATQVKVPGDPALKCWSDGHDGLWGQSKASGRSGVYGSNSHGKGFGVTGRNTSNGTVGIIAGPDAALMGTAPLSTAALRVEGKAHFSRSGLVTVKAGQWRASVELPVTSSSLVFATAQYPSAFFASAAYRTGDNKHIEVYLNSQAPFDIDVAWMVLD